jgi:hypothetical protein
VYTEFWWGKLKRLRPLGKPRIRWKNNIKIDLKEFVNGDIHWIDLFHDKDNWWSLVNLVVKIRVLQNAGDVISCFTIRTIGGVS